MKNYLLLLVSLIGFLNGQSKFKQLKEEWATPNAYRTASGKPGFAYYQQEAHYSINVTLDDQNQKIFGEEEITYVNNSPDELEYLWIQLDQNKRAQNSLSNRAKNKSLDHRVSMSTLASWNSNYDGGFKIDYVKDAQGKEMNVFINETMMRVILDQPLKSGESVVLNLKWWYNVYERATIGGRGGYEYFEKNDNYLYSIAQWFPRMAVYTDVEGWQNKQFLGNGEFALPFGNYKVDITVPEDHVVAATGVLQNAKEVLSAKQLARYKEAEKSFEEPVMIITPEEAKKNEKTHAKGTKTWSFKADSVRDFAFASSRKFIWDAMNVKVASNKTSMAMSFYPNEGNPLWEKYSTRVVAHTIKTYSKYTIDYPYPVAQSVNAKNQGMEYPMICYNFGRPEEDGTYSQQLKLGVIGVIIHEVGHNFFPMIINSDERQWTWMDEGLNTFVQYLTEQEWEANYPSRRGPAHKIVNYMKGDKRYITPIMTNSESILQFGNNAYGKPATGLNILRETVMGRELFDYAFKTYCERWAFKHPSPEDFFRTMEDASAVDLDWFWRGWFYTTDHVDIAIDEVNFYEIGGLNPKADALAQKERDAQVKDISTERNASSQLKHYADDHPEVLDFYSKEYSKYWITKNQAAASQELQKALTAEEKAILKENPYWYELKFANLGGMLMPVILKVNFEDGSYVEERFPVELWLKNETVCSTVLSYNKRVVSFELDPHYETADVERNNNHYPPKLEASRFELFKRKQGGKQPNEMQMQYEK